jgi:hypothetical protein
VVGGGKKNRGRGAAPVESRPTEWPRAENLASQYDAFNGGALNGGVKVGWKFESELMKAITRITPATSGGERPRKGQGTGSTEGSWRSWGRRIWWRVWGNQETGNVPWAIS